MGRAAVWTVAGAAFLAAVVLTLLGLGDNAAALPNWQALILGLVQGATELLPISSSGHLILVPWLADWEYLKEHDAFNQTFDVSLHLGTLVAVVLYFREDIVRLAAAWLGSIRRRRIETADERIAWCVAAATVPAAIVGAVGENLIAERLGEPWQIAILLALFGVVLYVADRRPQTKAIGDIGLKSAVAVGARAVALADAGRLALRDHDHRGPLARPRPRLGRAVLVPAARPDHVRGRRLQGGGRRAARRPAAGNDRPVRRRIARVARRARSSRSRRCSATSAGTTTPSSSSTG